MSLSIIIPTKDRGSIFRETLEAASNAIAGIPAEIIVINDSKTSEIELGDLQKENVRVINNPLSGVASARNLGVKNAKYEYLLFLDDDIVINKENINEALNYISNNENCALNLNWVYPPELVKEIGQTAFGRFLITNGYTSLKGWHRDLYWNDTEIFNCELLASYFLMIRKSDFVKAGGYNEAFPHAGAEDFDFAKRVNKNKIRTMINPRSTVYHNESDRMKMEPWINRKKRAAETRKVAVQLGYNEMKINAGKTKIAICLLLYKLKPFIYGMLKLVPNNKRFDFIFFRMVNVLITTHLYKGFFNSEKQK